jgi:uncharacterized protein DUF3175
VPANRKPRPAARVRPKPVTRAARKPGAIRKSGAGRKWSAVVSKRSDALDLEPGIFKQRSASRIASSLKRSAEASRRRKASPFQSAMSMLNFEINRAGKGLGQARRRVLTQAKSELRRAFGRPPP